MTAGPRTPAPRIAARRLLQPICEVTLLARELIRALRQIVELRTGLLLAHAVHHPLGLGQALRGAARIRLLRRALLTLLAVLLRVRLGLPHVIESLLQPVDRLLHLLLIAALASAGALPRLSGLSRLPGLSRLAALALLALLPLLSLLTLLSLLPLLTLLALLPLLLLLQLLHLLAQFFRFAPQHFLLPALLESLLLALLCCCASSCWRCASSRKLLQRVIHFLLPLFLRRRGARALARLVLILLRVQLQIEHARRDRGRAPPPPPPPPCCAPKATWISRKVASARNRCCSALCSGPRASFHPCPFSLSAAGPMSSAAASRSFTKFWNSWFAPANCAAARTRREGLGLVLQLGLHFGQESRVLRGLVLSAAAKFIPRRRNNFLLALRDFVLILPAAAAPAPAALCWDCV